MSFAMLIAEGKWNRQVGTCQEVLHVEEAGGGRLNGMSRFFTGDWSSGLV